MAINKGTIKGDTRSLDYSSFIELFVAYLRNWTDLEGPGSVVGAKVQRLIRHYHAVQGLGVEVEHTYIIPHAFSLMIRRTRPSKVTVR